MILVLCFICTNFIHAFMWNGASVLTPQCKVEYTVYTYSAVRDPLLVTVLLRPPKFLGQLGSVNVGVQLSY